MELPSKKCKFCEFQNNSWEKISNHVYEKHSMKLILKGLKCSKCLNFQTTFSKLFLAHVESCSKKHDKKDEAHEQKIDSGAKNAKKDSDSQKRCPSDAYMPKDILSKIDGHLCLVCKYMGPKRFDTIRHIRNIHLKIKNYQCNFCDFGSPNMMPLKKHFESNHKINDQDSVIEEKSYKEKIEAKPITEKVMKNDKKKEKNIVKPIKSENFEAKNDKPKDDFFNDEIFDELIENEKCLICHFSGGTEKIILRSHVKLGHFNLKSENPLQCVQCTYQSKNPIDLIQHLKKEHQKIIFQCVKCEKVFDIKEQLKEHFETKHLPGLKCGACTFTTLDVNELFKHVSKSHKVTDFKSDRISNDDWNCKFCSIFCENASELSQHLKKRHFEDLKENCCYCEYEKDDFYLMLRHIDKIHLGINRPTCQDCQATFSYQNDLLIHRRVHKMQKKE